MRTTNVPRLGIVLAAAAVLASGCATRQVAVDPAPSAEALGILSASASRAAAAQETLARVQTARTAPAPKPVAENLRGVPEALRRPTTIQWSGPGEEAARRIAGIVGFGFYVVGDKPADPPLVDLSYHGEPAVKVLEDIGYQSAPFAQVVADARTRRIEYRYVGTTIAPRSVGMTK